MYVRQTGGTRRAGVALAVGVAGCSGSPDDGNGDDDSPTDGDDEPEEVRVEMTDGLGVRPRR
ncbi:MAG: hypothetical protein U5K28_05220 [Halobacteriales archaeon]|nr:hypothetical protein [Halobacteriales archaeon]